MSGASGLVEHGVKLEEEQGEEAKEEEGQVEAEADVEKLEEAAGEYSAQDSLKIQSRAQWTPTPSAGSRVREEQRHHEVDRGHEVDVQPHRQGSRVREAQLQRGGLGSRSGRRHQRLDQEFGRHKSNKRWTGVKKWTPTTSVSGSMSTLHRSNGRDGSRSSLVTQSCRTGYQEGYYGSQTTQGRL
jgi:hypothetical protein